MGSEGAGPPRTKRLSATDPLAPLAPRDDDLRRAASAESDPGERPRVPVGHPGPGNDGAGEGRTRIVGAAPSPPEGPAGRPRPRSLPVAVEVRNGARERDTAAAPAERARAPRTCSGSLDSLEEELARIQRHDMVEDSSEGTPSPLPRLLQGLASGRDPRGYGPPAAPIDGRERDEEEDLIRKVLRLTTGGGTAAAGDAGGCSGAVKLGPCKDGESASSVSSPGESLRFDREPESLGSSPDDRSPGNGSSSCLPLSSRTAGSATSPSVSSLEDDSDASPGCRGVSAGAVVGGGRAPDDEVGMPRKNRSHSQNQQPPAIVDSSEEEEEALEGRVAPREQEGLQEAELPQQQQQQRRSAGRRSKREREDLRAQRRRQRSRASPSNLSPIEDASPTEELRQAAEMEELRRSSCSEYSPSIESEPEGFESYAEKIYRLQEEFKQLTSINRSASHEGSESYAARSRVSSERVLKSAEEAYEEMMIKSRARPMDDGSVGDGPKVVVEATIPGCAGALPCATGGGDTGPDDAGPGDAWHGISGRPYREETGGDAVFDFSRSRELRACGEATSTATPTMLAATGSATDYLGTRYGYSDLLGDVPPLLTPGISPTQLASPSPASRRQGRPGDVVNLSCGAGATIPAARPHVATAVAFPAIPAVRITQHFTDHEDGAGTAGSAEALPEADSQHDYRPMASDITVTTHTVPCSASPSSAQQQQLVTAPAVAEDVRLTSSLGYRQEPQVPISSSVKQPPPLLRSSSHDLSFTVGNDAMEEASLLHNLSSFSQGAGGGAGSRRGSSVDAEFYFSSELNPMALLYDAGESVDHVISRPPTASSAPCSRASGEEPGAPWRAFARPQACQWPDDGFGQRGEVEEEEEARCGRVKSRVVDLRMLKTPPLIMTDQGVDLTSFATESRRFGGDNIGAGAVNKPGSVVKPGIVNLSALDLNTSQSQSQKVTVVNRGTNVPTNYKVAARPVPSPHDVTPATTTTTSNSSNSISKPLNLAQNASTTTVAPTNGPAFGLTITAGPSVKAAAAPSAEASRAERAERRLGAAGQPEHNGRPNGTVGGGRGPGPRIAAASPDGRPDEAASGLSRPGEGPADLVRGGDGKRATCCDVVYHFPFLRSPSLWGKPPSASSPPPAIAVQGKADLLRRHESASAYHCFPLGPLRSSFSDTNLASIGDYGSCPFRYDGAGTGKVMDLTAKNGFVARGSLLSGDVGLGAKFALGAYTECGLRPMRRYNSDHAISKMECDNGSGGRGASREAHVDCQSTEETIREINKLCTELTSLQREWLTYSDGKGAAPTSQLTLAGYGVGAPALNALAAAVPSEVADYLVPAVPVTAQPSSIMGPLGAAGYRNGATGHMEAAPNFEDFLPTVVQQQQWRRGSGSRSFSAVLAGAGTQAYSPDAVTATVKTASSHLGYGIPQLCTAAAVAVAGPGGYFGAYGPGPHGDGAPPGCSEEENATRRLGPYVLGTIAPDTREGALVGQRWDEGEVTVEAEGRRWSLELEEHELLREKQAEQQQVQLQQQILELEKVKQRRLQEEMECERVEMRLRLDQEKRLVEQELSELHGMKRRLFRRQQEEHREQLSLQQEQMVHHHVQIDKIKQLQTQLQQQLEEQKMIQATPPVASVAAAAAFNHNVGPWWTTRAGQELGGPRWPAPGPHEAGAGGRVPRRPSRQSVARPTAELSLCDARGRRPPRRRSLGSGGGGARSSSYWEEDEEMDSEEEQNVGRGSVRRPWFDSGIRTDDDGDERRRSRRNGVDCGVQTDDEDGRGGAGWGSSSRRRRGRSVRASGPGREAVVGDGSPPARVFTSSIGVQTSADCSVQTEPAPGTVSRRDRDDFYDISKPERTHLGRSSGCQTDGDGGRRPAPLEIGAAGFHPSDAGAGEASPRSPKLLFSPVSPLACGKPLDAPFGTSERLNKAHVSPQKHLPPTPAARQGQQGPPSRRHEEEEDDGAGSHRGPQRSKAAVDGPGTGRKVKRTLPNPPMEERPPTGPAASSPSPAPSAASTRNGVPGAGGPDGRSAAPAGPGVVPVQRKQILREIDAELERVEHDSAKLRQRQEELDAEEREIDARMRNLERGLGRKGERNGGGDVGGATDPGRYPTARALGLDAGPAAPRFSPARRQQEACLPGLYPAPAGPVPPCRIFPSSSYLAYPQLRQADGAEAPGGYAPSSGSLPHAIPTAPYPGLTAPAPQLKARQASLDLEPNLETNYEVVAEEELLGALLARRRSVARGGRDDDGPSSDAATVPLRDLAAAVGFAANSDAFYADLEQSVPRNYELIDDISELTRTPAPSVVATGDPLQCRQRRRPPEREPPFGRRPYGADAEFTDDAYEQNLPRNLARFYRGDGNSGEPLGAVRAEPRHAEERPGHRPVSKAFSSAVISKRGKHKRQQTMEQRLAAAAAGAFGTGADADMGYTGRYDGTLAWPEERPRRRHGDMATPLGGVLLYDDDDDGEIGYNGYGPPLHDYAERYSCDPNAPPPPPRFPPPRHRRADGAGAVTPGADRAGSGRARERPRAASPERRARAAPEWDEAPGSEVRRRPTEQEARRRQPGMGARLEPLNQRRVGFPGGQGNRFACDRMRGCHRHRHQHRRRHDHRHDDHNRYQMHDL
uniref:Protein bassoon-like n=1 Tax=Petromyzon marinus TaxID=7757 RepID=A0AAJ7X918_PETMA|nr:protein bassoon-like [Petromyzon marinus]